MVFASTNRNAGAPRDRARCIHVVRWYRVFQPNRQQRLQRMRQSDRIRDCVFPMAIEREIDVRADRCADGAHDVHDETTFGCAHRSIVWLVPETPWIGVLCRAGTIGIRCVEVEFHGGKTSSQRIPCAYGPTFWGWFFSGVEVDVKSYPVAEATPEQCREWGCRVLERRDPTGRVRSRRWPSRWRRLVNPPPKGSAGVRR
jgi:hypothetical protein